MVKDTLFSPVTQGDTAQNTLAATPPHKGSITILKVQAGYIAAKTFTQDENGKMLVEPYNAGMYFNVSEENPSDIFDLSSILVSLANNPCFLVIRGATANGIDQNKLVKRRQVGSEDGLFESRKEGLLWLMLDIDGIPCPEGKTLLNDTHECLNYLISLLPEYFHGVTYHVHMSSSAGLHGGNNIRAHLWFWLSHPVTDAALKIWGKQINSNLGLKLIDVSLFHPVQPHYTADPYFKQGADDPFPDGRSALIKHGKDSVDFPPVNFDDAKPFPVSGEGIKPPPVEKESKLYAGCTGGLKPAHTYEQWVDLIGDHDGGEGFYEPLLHAAWHYVCEHGSNGTNIEALKQALRETINAADQSNHPDKSYIENKKTDVYLDSLIKSAMLKIGEKGKKKPQLIYGSFEKRMD